MSTARPDRFATRMLRGDLPAVSVLAVLLLLVQLFVAGIGVGRAVTGPPGSVLCTSAQSKGAAHPDHGDHGRECPCLAAGCCAAPAGGPPPEAAASWMIRPPAVLVLVRLWTDAEPERRPLALFARAGRGPPSLI